MTSKELTLLAKEMTESKETLKAAVRFVSELPNDMKRYHEESARVRNVALGHTPSKSCATAAPQEVLDELNKFWQEAYSITERANALFLLVHTRFPEIKPEDNDGVEVQRTMIECTNLFRSMVCSDSGSVLDPVRRYRYLKDRAVIEAKILGEEKKEEKEEEGVKKDSAGDGSKAPSYPLALWALDAGTLENLSISYSRLHDACLIVFTTYAKNQKRILTPRESDTRFVQ